MKKMQQLGLSMLIFLYMTGPESKNNSAPTVTTSKDSIYITSTATPALQAPETAMNGARQ